MTKDEQMQWFYLTLQLHKTGGLTQEQLGEITKLCFSQPTEDEPK